MFFSIALVEIWYDFGVVLGLPNFVISERIKILKRRGELS
jgi:hypothetical protein